MSTGQNSLYDRYKDRRNGTLFFWTLATFLGFIPVLGLAGIILQNAFPGYDREIVVGMEVILCLVVVRFFVRGCNAIAAARQRRREKAQLSKLSSDELVKARSKLVKNQNRISL